MGSTAKARVSRNVNSNSANNGNNVIITNTSNLNYFGILRTNSEASFADADIGRPLANNQDIREQLVSFCQPTGSISEDEEPKTNSLYIA